MPGDKGIPLPEQVESELKAAIMSRKSKESSENSSYNTTRRNNKRSHSGGNDYTPGEELKSPTLRDFTEPDALSNVVLEVEGTELHVHKEVLAGWSPVFMAMFTSQFLETEENKVKLTGKSLDDIQLLLNCLYPPNSVVISKDNVMNLLPLIEEYGITALKTKCEDVILTYEPSLEMVLVAHDYHLPNVMTTAISKCSKLPMSAIDHQKQQIVQHIPESAMLNIYREKILNQIETIKMLKKEKEQFTIVQAKITSWGTGLNEYPCERHRNVNENCALCLNAFKEYTTSQLKDLSL